MRAWEAYVGFHELRIGWIEVKLRFFGLKMLFQDLMIVGCNLEDGLEASGEIEVNHSLA